jgi:molecular chaperone GrpE (heat shock protein)
VHLTETCDSERPSLKVLDFVHTALGERKLLPKEHLVDSGYMVSKEMADSLAHYGVELFGPMPT